MITVLKNSEKYVFSFKFANIVKQNVLRFKPQSNQLGWKLHCSGDISPQC